MSVSLVEETGVPGGNHRPTASNWQTFSVVEGCGSRTRVQSRGRALAQHSDFKKQPGCLEEMVLLCGPAVSLECVKNSAWLLELSSDVIPSDSQGAIFVDLFILGQTIKVGKMLKVF